MDANTIKEKIQLWGAALADNRAEAPKRREIYETMLDALQQRAEAAERELSRIRRDVLALVEGFNMGNGMYPISLPVELVEQIRAALGEAAQPEQPA